jgi:Uncharacterized conserved protein (DUF2190)
MRNPGLTKTFVAEGDVPQRRIVAFTSESGIAALATGITGRMLGVCVQPRGAKDGERVDVMLDDIEEVEFGAAAAPGDWLTSDEDGRAIPATEGGSNVIGRAMEAVEAGAIGGIQIIPGHFFAPTAPQPTE